MNSNINLQLDYGGCKKMKSSDRDIKLFLYSLDASHSMSYVLFMGRHFSENVYTVQCFTCAIVTVHKAGYVGFGLTGYQI